MITTFSERARKVLKRANDEAERRGAGGVGAEHLLAGLLAEPRALASMILLRQGVQADRYWDAVDEPPAPPRARLPKRPLPPTPPLTPSAARALKRAGEAAEAYSRSEISTECLLLGLLRDREGPAARALVRMGIDVDTAQAEVVELLEATG